jgi:two-component system phosphate regulon sensor histidine kinase PhoR
MLTSASARVVWIVDDSPLDAERAKRLLQQECHVEVFLDGASALEGLASATRLPDVLVLDWVMPGVTGIDVCRFLRSAQGGMPQVGILLLTTHRQTEQIVEGLSAGANDYLAKPYADAELRARVHALVRTRQLIERAEEAEALSLQLLETSPNALIALDELGNIRFVNEIAREVLGQRGDVRVGMPLAAVLPEIDRRMQGAAAVDTLSLPDIKLGERQFAPTIRASPAGRLFTLVLALHDVTERRRMDARRLDFYSIIAHDLRSPLAALSLRLHLILEGRHGPLNDGLSSDLRKMDKSFSGMSGMIDDFLELARLENVGYDLESRPVDLNQLLAELMADQLPMLETRSLHWVREVKGATTAHGDARRLRQVLTNLITNAIKFTPEGGTLTTRIERFDREVEVSVSDTGRGIATNELPSLFERYTRSAHTQHEVPGTGLGLLIVREIVEAHGGSVGVQSTLGVGSRFWFRLPG